MRIKSNTQTTTSNNNNVDNSSRNLYMKSGSSQFEPTFLTNTVRSGSKNSLVVNYMYDGILRHITLLYVDSKLLNRTKLEAFANNFGRKYFGRNKTYNLCFNKAWVTSVEVNNASLIGNIAPTLNDIQEEIYSAFCTEFGKRYINTTKYKDGKIVLHSSFGNVRNKPSFSTLKVTFSLKWF